MKKKTKEIDKIDFDRETLCNTMRENIECQVSKPKIKSNADFFLLIIPKYYKKKKRYLSEKKTRRLEVIQRRYSKQIKRYP